MRAFGFVLLGGVAGFLVGASVYLSVNPFLERSTGLIRETQGLLWNTVPLATLGGMVVGWWLARRQSGR